MKLRVMISSRCHDPFPSGDGGRPMSDVRRTLKAAIEAVRLDDSPLFEVWINEDQPSLAATGDAWEQCLSAARECDILLALDNGNAGWSRDDADIGICHAELQAGINSAPAKVRLISLVGAQRDSPAAEARHRRFQEYVAAQNLFSGPRLDSEDALRARVMMALHDAVVALSRSGVRDASRGRYHSGTALDWTRLDFRARQDAMKAVVMATLQDRHGTIVDGDRPFVRVADGHVLCLPSAIPAAMTIASARELVGQPFKDDHLHASVLARGDEGRGGPLHVIACHRGATEAQAIRMLGFADATMVSAPFGVFVADRVQQIQFAFLVNCRDETTTRHNVQRFFEWLWQSGEDRLVLERARSRARIVGSIATELGRQDGRLTSTLST